MRTFETWLIETHPEDIGLEGYAKNNSYVHPLSIRVYQGKVLIDEPWFADFKSLIEAIKDCKKHGYTILVPEKIRDKVIEALGVK